MAITPINVSRTSFNMQTISLLDSLRRNTLTLFLEQNRMGTGNKLNAPSEDPVLANQATQLSEILERQDQILANIQHADSFLAATDSAVGEISDLLSQAHGIASEMVNSTADQAQRDSMAELVSGILNQLVTVGNRTYRGVYLFSGQATTSPSFTQTTGGVEYRGNTRTLTAHVDEFQDHQINLDGNQLFGALAGRLSGYVDLDPAVTTDIRLADLKGATGNGVQAGIVRISLDVPAVTFTADLSNASTVGDLIDMLNQAAEDAGLTVGVGQQFNATINAANDGLAIATQGTQVTIADQGGGRFARDLGILGTFGGIFDGGDINPRLTDTTTIASLFGGAGAVLGTIRIDNGTLGENIDLSAATTVRDVLNTITNAGVQVRAEINDDGDGLDIVNLMSGAELRVSETGDGTGELLGMRSMQANTLLSALNDGRGVDIREGYDDLTITARNGSSFNVRLDGSTTVQDVLDKINTAAAAAAVNVTASLPTTGNGIRLVDGTGGGGDLRVDRAGGSAAIDGLGLEKVVSANELVGDDVSGAQPDSVFTALMDLHEALVTGGEDVEQNITRAAEKIRGFITQVSRTQGMIGARSKAMSTRLDLTESAVLATQSMLSEVKDLDYTEAVTRFQQAQTTLQANLLTGSRLLQLSLLNYL